MKKKLIVYCLLVLTISSCKGKKNIPDVSGIATGITLERFDRDFFEIDTLYPEKSIPALQAKYPLLLPVFLQNILGLDSNGWRQGIASFIRLTKPIYDSAAIIFKNTGSLQNDFEKSFQFVKYHFPKYPVPKITTIIGPIDVLAKTNDGYSPDFIGPGFLGISLQFYLGQHFSVYQDEYFIANVAPQYRSRRFEKQYMVADAMKLVVDDLFPDKSTGMPLIEQMIEKGKQYWLLDQFLPLAPDSVKTGYTRQQLDWCSANEGLIWDYIVTNENLYSVDPAAVQRYIGESPSTQNMPAESPGNIGAWIGWQIVKKFATENSAIKPADLMTTDAKKILDVAKYKPK